MKKSRTLLIFLLTLTATCLLALTAYAAPAAATISASNVASSGKVKLTWDTVEGASKYRIYRSDSQNGSYDLIYTTTKTSVINADTQTGETYYYYIVSVASDGSTSAKSNTVSRTCDLPSTSVTLSNVASSGKIKVT